MSSAGSLVRQNLRPSVAASGCVFPDDAHAIIYRPCRSAMTSGKRRAREWMLRFERRTPPFIEPLMGWTGGDDPLTPVELSFPSLDSAVAYARRQGLDFTVNGAGQAQRMRPIEKMHALPMAQRWRLEWVERTLGPELCRGKSGLDPALRYADPNDVLHDPALSEDEKRDVLHRWAVDAYLVELALWRGDASNTPSRLADVMDALRILDCAKERADAA